MRRDDKINLGFLLQSIFSNLCTYLYSACTEGKLKIALLLFLIDDAVGYFMSFRFALYPVAILKRSSSKS